VAPLREGFQTITIGGRDGALQATFAPDAARERDVSILIGR
jgi:hypothetical protein